MGVVMMTRLLLMILLVQQTQVQTPTPDTEQDIDANHESNNASHVREFCLRISEEVKPASSRKRPKIISPRKNKLNQTNIGPHTKQISEPTNPNRTTKWTSVDNETIEVETESIHLLSVLPSADLNSDQLVTGCRCHDGNKKLATETTPVRSTTIWPPDENCNSTEYIETLTDLRTVCVPPSNLLTYITASYLRAMLQNYEMIPLMTPGPQIQDIPAAPSPETHPAPTDDDIYFYEEEFTPLTTSHNEDFGPASYGEQDETNKTLKQEGDGDDAHCRICNKTWDPDNPESVKSLKVDVHKFPCPLYISVNLKDEDFCLDSESSSHKNVLKLQFDTPLLSKNHSQGCRCHEKLPRLANETVAVRSAMIWAPTENCSSTEFIETLEDGREVCANESNFKSLLDFIFKIEDPNLTLSILMPKELIITNVMKKDEYVISDRSFQEKIVHDAPPEISCSICPPRMMITTDILDFRSLDVVMEPNCPAIIHVLLMDSTILCIDSYQLDFTAVLQKLQFQLE